MPKRKKDHARKSDTERLVSQLGAAVAILEAAEGVAMFALRDREAHFVIARCLMELRLVGDRLGGDFGE